MRASSRIPAGSFATPSLFAARPPVRNVRRWTGCVRIALSLIALAGMAGGAAFAKTLTLAPGRGIATHSSRADWSPPDSVALLSRGAFESVGIGAKGEFKDYYRIDEGCPLLLQGPGTLRFYVRAHREPSGQAPTQVTVVLAGLEEFGDQTWTRPVGPSPARYADERPGKPTDGQRISLAFPAGLHRVTVTGTCDAGGPVYAQFLYEGPEAGAAPPAPEEAAESEPAAAREASAGKAPARSRASAAKASAKPWGFTSDFMLDFIYDDNIARFSDSTLNDLESGLYDEKFGIDTRDDLIINPALAAEASHKRLLFNKESRFRVRYQRWDYARNSIKTNEEVNLRARQYARAGDYVEASYTYAPKNYIKELSDRPPFTSTSVPREYLHFEVKRNTLYAAYYWRAKSWLRMRFQGGRTWRFYNRPFLENDLWEWNGQVSADLRYRRLTTRLQYAYADVQARGYDEVGETLETADNGSDGSYEKDTYLLRFSYAPRKRAYMSSGGGTGVLGRAVGIAQGAASLLDRGLVYARTAGLEVEFTYTRQFYTSQLPLYIDATHVGRLDQSYQIEIIWSSQPLYRKTTLEAGFRFTERTADAPAGLIGEDDPSEEKDYTGSRYWIAFSTPLR